VSDIYRDVTPHKLATDQLLTQLESEAKGKHHMKHDSPPNCGGFGFIMVERGPNQAGECCRGCPDCDPFPGPCEHDFQNNRCVICGECRE
jgi:hypothetical protein